MYYDQYTAVTWIVVPCYIITIVSGLFGNVFILRAYYTDPAVQEMTYHFLLANGALTDLVICCIFTPLLLIYRANERAHTIESSPLCELSIFSSTLCISIQYVVFPLLSINRHDLASRPLAPWLTKKQCKKILIGAWAACAILSFIQAGIAHLPDDSDDTPKLYRCILVTRSLDPFSGSFFVYAVLLFCASIFVTVRCYAQIYRRISMEESLHTVLGEDDVGRAKACVLVAIVYSAFWTPFVLVQFYGMFASYTEVVFNLHALSSILGVMASAVTPYMFCSLDRYYRRRFLELVGCSQGDQVEP